MRNFTDTEQDVVKKLIEWCSEGQSITLGEVLCKLFPEIEYIKPYKKQEGEFYKHTINICYNEKQCSLSNILEAVNLFDLLVEQNYIIVKQLCPIECIGKEHQGMYLFNKDVHYIETSIVNYYQYDLWEFLCNHFYVTNALVDFATDFKTPEQRRHHQTIKISKYAILSSIVIGIISPFISNCLSQKSDRENLEQVIFTIQKSMDKFPNIITDTFNVKITDTLNKQPINLEETLKKN